MSTALLLNQLKQLENPDWQISLHSRSSFPLVSTIAHSYKGISTYDDATFLRKFWELEKLDVAWRRIQSTTDTDAMFGGMEGIVLFEGGTGRLRRHLAAQSRDRGDDKKGRPAWGKRGVAISQMRDLRATFYTGELFQNGVAIVIPADLHALPALWCFCSSPDYTAAVRQVNQKLSVDNGYLTKVPFDLDHWKKVADERYPDGLPEPHSDDPTQWLFRGDIPSSTEPLHVALARLLGYAWPDQLGDGLCHLLDADGIVTLAPLVHQEGVANRLRALLRAAYESPAPQRPKGAPEVEEPRVWDETTLPRLLARASSPGMSLEEWLRDKFFESHCKLFHQRPFLWHVWDGRKDGFHAIVNYHKLDGRNLDRLTHVYLGEWIERQKAASDSGDRTADARLIAAQDLQKKLELIRTGEQPYDIFIRWKSLAEQPMGWDPDFNDGVRMNIRPFVEAGILRGKVNVNWNKDRGKDPPKSREQFPWMYGWEPGKHDWSGVIEKDGKKHFPPFDGNRWNDLHYSLALKRAAREAR